MRAWAAIFLLLLTACTQEPSQLKAPRSLVDTTVADTTGMRSLAILDSVVAERRRTGDSTITRAKKLRALLTDTIPGYTLQLDLADSLKMPLSVLTEAKRVFYNPDEAYIELVAADYIRDPEFIQINLQRYNLAQGVEISGVRDVKRQVPGLLPTGRQDAFTWSSYNRRRKLAQVFIGVDYRYFITVEASAQDSFLDLNRVAGWLRWEALPPVSQ